MSGMYPDKNRSARAGLRKLKNLLKPPFFRRLSTRLLFTLTMLSALPLIMVGLFMRSITQESISAYTKNQHSLIARRAANEIKLFLETPSTTLKILLETRDINDMNPFALNLILNKVISEYQPIFDRIFTIDTLGNEVTTSDFGPHVTHYRTEEFFVKSVEGVNYLSSVKFNDDQEPYIIMSYPIKQFQRIKGILVAEINLKSIWDLVDEIKVGETGNAFVVTEFGQLIAHPDKKKVIDRVKVIDLNTISEVRQPVESSRIFDSPEGVEMLGTFAHIDEFNWILVIQQPLDEAFSVASRMLYQVFAFVALVIIVAIILAYLLEKRITAPITALINGAKRYAEGDLDFRIKIEKYEEIEMLAREFNSMAAGLLENQRKLRRIERLAAMSKFATLVSHEIRNPLNSMNINMQILKREMENPRGDAEKKQKYFDIIVSEINRMDNLIKNFLMISRPPRFDFLPNNIHDILDQVILMHKANAEQQNVVILKEYQRGQNLVNVDHDQMKQVFHNIIINALQAMPEGGQLTVKTRIKRNKDRSGQNWSFLCIEFKDTGIGIPADKVNEIFEVYYTMKKTGTGLGLAIARQIIEGHFGSIQVKSELGKGAIIIINIPVAKIRDSAEKRKHLKTEF
jgi:two-component system NtrC family sensor kinase